MFVDHGARGDLLRCVGECALQRVTLNLQYRLTVLHWVAPDFPATGQRRRVVDVHLAHEIAWFTLERAGDDLRRCGVSTEAFAIGQIKPLYRYRVAGRLKWLRQVRANDVGICFVTNHQILAVEKFVRAARVSRALQRHRCQTDHIFFVHGYCLPIQLSVFEVIEQHPAVR